MRAQGSLEFLIILATVIAVMAVVASFVIGYFSTQSDQFYYASCSNAAAICRDTLIVSPGYQCPMCNSACNFSNGTEIFNTAALCCKQGKPGKVYHQSGGCGIPIDCSLTACPSPQSCYAPTNTCGTLVFTPSDIKAELTPAISLAIGDVNPTCSGNEVIVGLDVGVPTSYQIKMYCFNGVTWDESFVSPPWQQAVYDIAIGNADNKGTGNEIVAGLQLSSNELRMYKNTAGVWSESTIANLGASVYAVAIGNADNGAGPNKVVSGAYNTLTALQMHIVDMFGTWTTRPIKTYPVPTTIPSLSIADIDGVSGNEVIAAVNQDSISSWSIRMYKYSGGWSESPYLASTSNKITEIAVGDADNDFKNEIVFGMEGVNEVNMLDYVGSSWVQKTIATGLPNSVISVAIGDANTDGYKEIVVGLSAIPSRNVRMYKNESGTWTETIVGNEGNYAYEIAIGDADNRGTANDLVVSTQNPQNKVKIYTGTWTFP